MRIWALHLGALALLLALHLLLPDYQHATLARIMALGAYASAYNIAFGYAGLLSLGHALFFGAGLYAAGLAARFLQTGPLEGMALGLMAGAIAASLVGALALRTRGVAFMIVTLMFAQAGYLTALYFGDYTRGDEGFTLPPETRDLLGWSLTEAGPRYLLAWALLALSVITSLLIARSGFGRALAALRENEERTRLLGYDVDRLRLMAMALSGALAGLSGAGYAVLFGYVGASFAASPWSIMPLLYTLTGGAGTVLGPFLGSFIMFHLVDLSSAITDAHMLVVGVALILLILFFPKGLLGALEAWRKGGGR